MWYEDVYVENAKECAGNHRKFDSFYWSGKPEDDQNWFLFYTHNRDSDILELSNAHVIEQALSDEKFSDDVISQSHGHWAVGHVDGFAIRVYDADGKITPAFKELCELAASLADYPVLDDSDYSQREYDATLENIRWEGSNLVKDDTPDGWEGKVFSWLWEHKQTSLENTDGQGGLPDEEDIGEALEALGLRKQEEDE